jgi:hypothetical protein
MTAPDIYQRQGFGGTLEIVGHMELLIVDFVIGFADPDVVRPAAANAPRCSTPCR